MCAFSYSGSKRENKRERGTIYKYTVLKAKSLIKEKCDCTRPEDVVDWKKNKGVVGGIRDAIRPTTEEKAFLLALYEMTRLICINKYGADRSFSI